MFEPMEGGCRCGQVRLRIGAPPLLTMACHCTGCQRMTGSAFSLSAALPVDGFAILAGEPARGGLCKAPLHHMFCPRCMSWLFTRADGMDSFVNLRPTMLDAPRRFVPYVETFTREKLPWAATPAVHGFEAFPPMEAFEGLTKDYAGWAHRMA